MKSFEEIEKFITEDVRSLSAMHETERRALYDYCQKVPKDGLVVEVGCQLGCSSAIIASVGYERGYRTIHIDPYTQQPEYLNGWTNMMLKLTGDWEHAFTLLCMRTEQAEWHLFKMCDPLNIDLAFIDGDHECHNVLIDIRLVGQRVRPGGYMLAHDYEEQNWPGVKAAFDTYMKYSSGSWEKVGQHHSMGAWRRI